MNISAPVSMLVGRGSGPALLVAGLLVAVWLAHQASNKQASQPGQTLPLFN